MNIIKRICNWYFSRNALPYWCILALDCTAVFISGLLVTYLEHGGLWLAQHFWPVTLGLLCSLIVFIIAFAVYHTFRGVMRYSSFVDLTRLALSTATSCLIVIVLHILQDHLGIIGYVIFPNFRGAVLLFIVATSIMCALRVIVKSLHDTYCVSDTTRNIFIYGCLSGGIALAKSVRIENPARFRLKGFISGDQQMDGSWMLGVPVYYDDDKVVEAMVDKGVTVLLVSPIQSERFTNRTTLIDALVEAGIKIMMMPQAEEWDGKSGLSHNQLKEVEIEDLLPRKKIEVDMEAIGAMLKGKRILITGAAGSIGSEMARQAAKFAPTDLILIDQAETPMHDVRLYMANNHSDLHVETIVTSICKQDRMESIFAQYRPEYVFHAAAYKHVPMMENNPAEAVQNNIYGTRVVADLAVKYGTKKFVMISTDKAVNPTNVMGCSKRICEIYCQSLNAAVQQVQNSLSSSNGSKGLNQAAAIEQIEQRSIEQQNSTTDGNIRRFSNISESKGTLEAGLSDNQTGGVQVRQSLCTTDSSVSGICDGQHSGGVRETREQGVQEFPVHSEGILRRAEESSDESSRCELHNGRDVQSDVCGLQEVVDSNSQLHQNNQGFGLQGQSLSVGLEPSEAIEPLEPFELSKLRQYDGSLPCTQFVTTRFGNVLGSNGSVIPIFREQIKKGGPVKVTHPDIIRYFMLIPEACRLVLEAGTMGNGGEIFVFDMGEPVKIVDLAKRMIALSGAKDIKIEFTGLRDGEKLYEELLATKENTIPTVHPKIMVAKVREYPYELALKNELELYEISKGFDDMAIVKKMKEIVPEYKSFNSKYKSLYK